MGKFPEKQAGTGAAGSVPEQELGGKPVCRDPDDEARGQQEREQKLLADIRREPPEWTCPVCHRDVLRPEIRLTQS